MVLNLHLSRREFLHNKEERSRKVACVCEEIGGSRERIAKEREQSFHVSDSVVRPRPSHGREMPKCYFSGIVDDCEWVSLGLGC